jgi:hypothetical protein
MPRSSRCRWRTTVDLPEVEDCVALLRSAVSTRFLLAPTNAERIQKMDAGVAVFILRVTERCHRCRPFGRR